ncbi:DUF1579 domain-containing protein [Chitinophaga barathri]|uniref:DUF1579 domain-containing protein n=1 Tax=Chitinophaga barathri TaxID=1647451 RepID=A0A3N4MZR7_9BACT|nr:DUF1579 domain-containing protein [Chitinophaga barathri]RPD40853.1 DUF1579 domain-containing protein [Chitinophaga barathri]
MKRILLALTAMLTALAAHSQDEASMKAWMDYATPGSMQKMIAMADGEWKADMTFWMAPGAPPMTTTGSCTNKMIMGGRYQESRYTSTMDGQPFEGTGILGYDNVRKVFITTWIDNMGTGVMYLEGKLDDATRTITFTGTATDAIAGKAMPVRQVVKWVDDNNQVMEMYSMANGTEFKSMELKFTRK